MLDKHLFYDWLGLNETIFKWVNSIHEETYDMVMILLSQLADKHNLPYYLVALVLWAFGNFIAKKISSTGGANQYLIMWMGALLVLVASFGVDKLVVDGIKEEFAYPRPYEALGPQDVHVLEYGNSRENQSHRSFPSGHVSMITIIVIGLWPVLSITFRKAGLLLILLVAWSRMAMGMHFPADVLAGFLISLVITLIVRSIIYRILLACRIRC